MRGVAVTVEATVAAPVDRAVDVIAPIDLPTIFRGLGPLPGVAGTREQTGGWDHVGAKRVVDLADGSEAHERLTAYERPRHFSYRVSGFTGPLRRVVEHADGAWWFADGDGPGTGVRWTYTFRPRRLARPLVAVLIVPLWRAYARRALTLAVAEVERRHAAVDGAPA